MEGGRSREQLLRGRVVGANPRVNTSHRGTWD